LTGRRAASYSHARNHLPEWTSAMSSLAASLAEESPSAAARPAATRRCPLCEEENFAAPPSRYSRDGWQLKDCGRCGLLYLENPPPLDSLACEHSWNASARAESQRKLESQGLWGSLRLWWKRWRAYWLPHGKEEALIEQFIAAGNVLDVGCGHGALLERLPQGLIPHGIEIDPDAIPRARARAEARGGQVVHADALSGLAALPAGSMQGILMQSYLEHETQPLAALRAAQRVLAGDGAIIIKVPNFASWLRSLWYDGEWPGFRYPDHVNYYTPETLSALVLKAGLRIIRFAWHDQLPFSDNMWLVAGKAA
jgi:SAM-dependent methyltransferase